MPDDVFTAARRYCGAPPELEMSQLGHYGAAFIAGAAWGLQAAKLSQAEIAAIAAAATTQAETEG